MASPRTGWRAAQRFARRLVSLTPESVQRGIQQGIQRGLTEGIRIGLDLLAVGDAEPSPAIPAGRPVTSVSAPTAQRARRLAYAPNLNGRADPGEIVWTWVAYEEDATRGKDRPVLVIGRAGRDRHTLLGLMLSSQDSHRDDANWVAIGSGGWGYLGDQEKPSWVRLDRVLDVPEEGIRREGAILPRAEFDVVAARLRADYCWT